MNIGDVHEFTAMCEALDLEAPWPLVRALELVQVARAHADPPEGALLGMTDDECRERVEAIALRSFPYSHAGFGIGLARGVEQVETQLLSEAREATAPLLDAMCERMRPKFDAAAAPIVEAAARYGFTSSTTAAVVLALADERAADAWRAAQGAHAAVQPIAAWRFAISRVFDVSPTPDELREHHRRHGRYDGFDVNQIDYSVCFVQGDNWSFDHERGRGGKAGIDWLALAAGGLRLNSPSETRAKIRSRASGTTAAASAKVVTGA